MVNLNEKAVGCLKGEDAGELLKAFMISGAAMAQQYHFESTTVQPQGTGAGDKLVKPR